ncbi:hypothetical protein SRABI83_03881 [Arthrobacter sp. Bi83]|nr:hypothetical protein SRABI83_03881 [Arthrobacter sp. Bi83]
MDVRGVPGQQHTAAAVGRGLARGVGEPRDPCRSVDTEVGVIDLGQRLAEVSQGGLGRRSKLLLGHDHPRGPPVLHQVQPVDPHLVDADARRRLLGHLHFGDQAAPRRIPAGELDAGCLADSTSPAVGADQVQRAHRPDVGEMHVDPAVVLGEAGHLEPPVDRHTQLLDPSCQDPLYMVLPKAERVRVPCRKVTHVQHRFPEERRLDGLALGEEPVGNPALIEDFDRPRVEPACTRADQFGRRAALHNRRIHPRQRQLTGQHHPSRTASGNNHINHLNPRFSKPFPYTFSGPVRASLRHDGGLAASPYVRDKLEVATHSASRHERHGRRMLRSTLVQRCGVHLAIPPRQKAPGVIGNPRSPLFDHPVDGLIVRAGPVIERASAGAGQSLRP